MSTSGSSFKPAGRDPIMGRLRGQYAVFFHVCNDLSSFFLLRVLVCIILLAVAYHFALLRNRFVNYHPEKIASAQERYVNEVKRIMSVLNTALEGKEWLVGDKCTYADLAFVSWDAMLPVSLGDYYKTIDFETVPHYRAWYERLRARKSVETVLALRTNMMEDLGIGKLGKKN